MGSSREGVFPWCSQLQCAAHRVRRQASDDLHQTISPLKEASMGKGDARTKRGKIWRGSYGKSRPQTEAKKAGSGQQKSR